MESRNYAACVVVDARFKFVELKNRMAIAAAEIKLANKENLSNVQKEPFKARQMRRDDLERLLQCREYLNSGVEKLSKLITVFDEIGIECSQFKTGLNLAYSQVFKLDEILTYPPNARLLDFAQERAKERGAA